MKDRPGILAPPPLIFAVFFAIGYFTRDLLPQIEAPLWFFVSLIVAGFAFGGAAAWRMVRAKTSVDPYEATTAIVTTGPFRVTRNPLYVSLTLVYVGFALLCRSLSALALLPIVIAVMTYGVIRREERYLATKFGEEYLDYCARVRRWI